MPAQCIELVRLRPKEGFSDQAIVAAYRAANVVLKAQWTGLHHTALVKFENGEYLHVVEWATRDDAQIALDNSGDIAEVITWIDMFDVVFFEITEVIEAWT